MKERPRKITVSGRKYVWWHRVGGGETEIYLSPSEDKTSVVCVAFGSENPMTDWFGTEYVLSFTAADTGEESKLLEPKAVALLIALSERAGLFESRKRVKTDGWELLKNAGYEISAVKKGYTW